VFGWKLMKMIGETAEIVEEMEETVGKAASLL